MDVVVHVAPDPPFVGTTVAGAVTGSVGAGAPDGRLLGRVSASGGPTLAGPVTEIIIPIEWGTMQDDVLGFGLKDDSDASTLRTWLRDLRHACVLAGIRVPVDQKGSAELYIRGCQAIGNGDAWGPGPFAEDYDRLREIVLILGREASGELKAMADAQLKCMTTEREVGRLELVVDTLQNSAHVVAG